jgi:CHAD domain-containing protein
MSVGALRSELLKHRLDHFARMLHGVEHGEMRSIHRARVASRRLRELMPVLRLDNDVSKKLARRLRQVTTRLGAVRELDVLIRLTDDLHQSHSNLTHALQRVGLAISKERNAARKHLADDLPLSQMQRIARKLDRVCDHLRGDEETERPRPVTGARAVRWAVEARVVHRADRLQSAIGLAGAVYLPERLHAVRIALKKLRYAAELFADVRGRARTAAMLGALKRNQDVLGRMHDLQMLIDRVRDVQASLAPPSLAVWRELDALVLALEDECRRLHARYVRDRAALTAITSRLAARSPASPQTRRAG